MTTDLSTPVTVWHLTYHLLLQYDTWPTNSYYSMTADLSAPITVWHLNYQFLLQYDSWPIGSYYIDTWPNNSYYNMTADLSTPVTVWQLTCRLLLQYTAELSFSTVCTHQIGRDWKQSSRATVDVFSADSCASVRAVQLQCLAGVGLWRRVVGRAASGVSTYRAAAPAASWDSNSQRRVLLNGSRLTFWHWSFTFKF
jgi:hypothetical protein